MTFDRYAIYFVALYQDKDYATEYEFLEKVFSHFLRTRMRTILALGYGICSHATRLIRQGSGSGSPVSVGGNDLASASMQFI